MVMHEEFRHPRCAFKRVRSDLAGPEGCAFIRPGCVLVPCTPDTCSESPKKQMAHLATGRYNEASIVRIDPRLSAKKKSSQDKNDEYVGVISWPSERIKYPDIVILAKQKVQVLFRRSAAVFLSITTPACCVPHPPLRTITRQQLERGEVLGCRRTSTTLLRKGGHNKTSKILRTTDRVECKFQRISERARCSKTKRR